MVELKRYLDTIRKRSASVPLDHAFQTRGVVIGREHYLDTIRKRSA